VRQYYLKNKAVMKWYGDELLREINTGKEHAEKEVAERVYRRVLSQTPVGKYGMSFKTQLLVKSGKIKTERLKNWRRFPGALRSSIQKLKSKFQDGGYIVYAGDKRAWYANIVEWGTTTRRQKTTGRFTGRQQKGKRYLRKAIAFEKSYLIKKIRQSIMMMRDMNRG
jgi:hypothetical protein